MPIKKIGVWFLLPWFVSILYFLLVYKRPFYLVESGIQSKQKHPVCFSSDGEDYNGNTTVRVIQNTSNKLTFDYTLKKGYKFLYASAGFCNKQTPFDFSAYDEVFLRIKARKGKRLLMILHTDENLNIKHSRPVFYQSVVHASPDFTQAVIPLKDFYIPEWILMVENTQIKDYPTPHFSKVSALFISNCMSIKPNVQDRIEVEEWGFRCNLWKILSTLAFFLLMYYVIAGLVVTMLGRRQKQSLRFEPQDFASMSYDSQEEQQLFEFILGHYTKELNLALLQKQTGLKEKDISSVIHQKTGLNYKQFLLRLRLTEAKRLIKETDRQISEIAYEVGFGNVSHFNRVFKAEEGCSPNQYRKSKTVKTSGS